MQKLADDLHILSGFPPYAINVYLMGDVLVDAGSRHAAKRILRQLNGRTVSAHALTHAHADHQGSSHEVCEELRIPLWCGEHDADAVEDGRIRERMPSHPINSLISKVFPGPPHPVARRLNEGDEVAGFTVLDVPGHSAGHVAYWRDSDRTLICGDVFTNMDTITGVPGLHQPKAFFTPDPARNRESMRRLATLEPKLVCFGHGRPLRDPEKLKRFTDRVAGAAAAA
ncbi:MAG TPA: MBL fold metallo-hydrolase [Solirubrobacteraceae bacterium]|nr:MBL fold metallo-hydrolase [Solirubrobacteraceae bacterium]